MVVVLLLKLIFLALTMITNMVSRLIFTATAYLLVTVIQAFKVPGEALQGGLEQVGNSVKACFSYLLDIAMELASSQVTYLLNLVVKGISESMVATGSAIGELVDKMRTSIDGLLEGVPELIESFSEMVSKVVSDLWNNYKDAMEYAAQNS